MNLSDFLFVTSLTFLLGTTNIPAQEPDSTRRINIIKIDFVPFYYDFFDTRVQARMGVEYERQIREKYFISYYLDMGLFDQYHFSKYYNFFNENEGFYSTKQKISIRGAHFLPGYQYIFPEIKKRDRFECFSGALLDIFYYQKKLDTYNSLTKSAIINKYDLLKIGAGLNAGARCFLNRVFLIEVKTAFIAAIYNYSENRTQNQMSLNAQWNSPNYRFWWSSNIKLGYAF